MRVAEGTEARNQPVVELECCRLFLSSIEVKSSLITRMNDTPAAYEGCVEIFSEGFPALPEAD